MARRLRLLAPIAAACCWLVPAIAAGAGQPRPRLLTAVLSPAEGDLAIAELSFPDAHGRALTARSVRVLSPGHEADDLIALATPARPRGGARVALALVANRPTNLADPASVKLRVLAAADLGPARVRRLEDPVKHRQAAPAWLCALGSHERAPALVALSSRGAPVAGLGAAGAVAQAFEIACHLPGASRLEAALAPPQPAPEPAPPAPSPPEEPKCAPCGPEPGHACPLTATAAYCVAATDETARAATSGARASTH